MAKVQPIAQLLAHIVRHWGGIDHGVFGQKTRQAGTVEVGTRQGSRHGQVRLGSESSAAGA
jgi:hypothetical protein